eukprot:574077-Pelagomonas_calceolata.AAC.10
MAHVLHEHVCMDTKEHEEADPWLMCCMSMFAWILKNMKRQRNKGCTKDSFCVHCPASRGTKAAGVHGKLTYLLLALSRNNTAHSTLGGMWLEAISSQVGCTGIHNFTTYLHWDFGIITVEGERCALLRNTKHGVLPARWSSREGALHVRTRMHALSSCPCACSVQASPVACTLMAWSSLTASTEGCCLWSRALHSTATRWGGQGIGFEDFRWCVLHWFSGSEISSKCVIPEWPGKCSWRTHCSLGSPGLRCAPCALRVGTPAVHHNCPGRATTGWVREETTTVLLMRVCACSDLPLTPPTQGAVPTRAVYLMPKL